MTSFLEENKQIGSALQDLIHFYSRDGGDLMDKWKELMGKRSGVMFFGMGTSEFTPQLIQMRLMELGLFSATIDAGEWYYYGTPFDSDRLLAVLTSQSGESIEIKKLIEDKRISMPFAAITNDISSTLGTTATLTLPLCAGEEKTITTKTFTNTMALLYVMAEALTPGGSIFRALEDLKAVTDLLAYIEFSDVQAAAEILKPVDDLSFVARGPAIVSAKQGALTFMEGTRCVTSAFTGGSFNHGPFESVDESFRLVVFRPDGSTAPLMERIAEKAAEKGAGVSVFTNRQVRFSRSIAVIEVPGFPGERGQMLFPLLAAMKQNHLLHLIAESRGIDAGNFRYGTKITAQE